MAFMSLSGKGAHGAGQPTTCRRPDGGKITPCLREPHCDGVHSGDGVHSCDGVHSFLAGCKPFWRHRSTQSNSKVVAVAAWSLVEA